MNTIEKTEQYIAHTYSRVPLALASGKGSLLYDEAGKTYIDLGSGIAVNVFGVCDEAWEKAVCTQAGKLQHCSNYYYMEPQAELAALLCQKSGMKNIFFCNSGAEANECAIKAARKYSSDKYGPGRHGIITLVSSFHGRTMATLSATGQEAMHVHFGPFLPGFVHVPADDIGAMKQALDKGDICAIMMEMIQGEGGVHTLDKPYVQAVAKLCAERDVLLLIDEVQCGNGRTGKYFAYMHYDVHPDIVSTAKAIAGGLPMGATLFGEKTENVLSPGTHGSTYGGNPICAAAGVSIVSRIDDALMDEVTQKGAYVRNRLCNAPGVEEVTGMGLMLGVKTKKDVKDVIAGCRDRGVIILSAKDKVRLLPALNIPMDLLEKGINILMEVIAQ
ncbi:MAG: aspartate aminotransferase family protein [Candidatus Pelethousia sp.]|nr:aspartate aminotransferase family protein [Candidatus Pelethousia sp.]